jgi:hypothetical protein
MQRKVHPRDLARLVIGLHDFVDSDGKRHKQYAPAGPAEPFGQAHHAWIRAPGSPKNLEVYAGLAFRRECGKPVAVQAAGVLKQAGSSVREP